MKTKQLLTLLLLLVLTFSLNAQVIYVNQAATGANSGTSWTNAFLNLQDAIDAANTNDEIWVAAGTYLPTKDHTGNATPIDNRNKNFHLSIDMKIYGGFVGTETLLSQRNATTNSTVLSGDFNNDDVVTGGGSTLTFSNNTENAYHVLITAGLTNASLLDGFTIEGGNANGSGDITFNSLLFSRQQGGAMNNFISSPTIINSTFENNNAILGGAMCNLSSSPTITNTIFENNNASGGGAMDNRSSSPTITNTIFENNNAFSGGAILNNDSSPTISNATFVNNNADIAGGAVRNEDSSSPTINNTIFENNNSNTGAAILNNHSSATITNSTFVNNNANFQGGGIWNNFSSPTVTNTIFWNNNLFGNTSLSGADIFNLNFSTPIVSYSLTQLNSVYSGGTGIINNEDPLFVDATNSDFSLSSCSPLINAGTPDTTGLNLGLIDFTGNPRIFDNRIDIGAYELQSLKPNPLLVTNTNNDGCGSLRYAVANATAADTIRFSPIINGDSIKLTTGQILINKNLTIIGNSQDSTIIDGNGNSRIFEIQIGSSLKIYNVKLQNGRASDYGGAIKNAGTLMAENCHLVSNKVVSSGFGGGGAIYNIFNAHLTNCLIAGNEVNNTFDAAGGGIYSLAGTLTIKNCQISGNRVASTLLLFGTYLYNAEGGGIYSGNTTLTIYSSTISGNRTNLANPTAGGLFMNSGLLDLRNSILVRNFAGNTLYDLYGANIGPLFINTTHADNNLISTTVGHNITNGYSNTHVGISPQFVQNVPTAPSLLGNLRLLPCSPAINAGTTDTTGLNLRLVDLAGNPRVFGGIIDIGAYESDETGMHTLASSLNPSVVGEQVTFTSTITPSNATGNIEFKEGSTVLSTQSLSGGAASFSKSDLSVGSHTITAHYSGSCPNLTPVSNALIQVIEKATATLTLSSSKNPSTFGENVTFSAIVSPSTTTGTVVFKEAGLPIGSTSLSGTGVATLSIATLSSGVHNITAEYGGDANNDPASSLLLVQQVDKASSSIALVSDISTGAFGAAITFTATLSPTSPTGAVVFKEGATTLGTISINSSGEAVLVLSTLPVGNHAITAEYAGDANFTGSSSSVANVSVGLASTNLALVASLPISVYGTSVDFTATVTPISATGNIVFKEGSSILGTVALTAGSATMTLNTLTAGVHNIIASYEGDGSFGTSSSTALVHTVTCPSVLPAITFTGIDLLNCAGGSVNRTANGAASYVWSNGLGTNAIASISAAGTYTVTATFISGCTSTATINIAAPIQPTILAGAVTNPTTCGGTGKIAFTTSNIPGGTYSLSFIGSGMGSSTSPKSVTVTSNSFELTGLFSGAYSNFSMDVAGCTASSSQSKALNDPSSPSLLVGTVTQPTVCGGTGSVAFSSSNLPDGTYSLSYTGAGSPSSVMVSSNAFTLTALLDGTYSNFSITNLGCTGSDASSVTLNDPDSPTLLPGLVTEPSICGAEGSIAFTSTNLPDATYSISYAGSGSPKNVTVNSNSFDLTGLIAGTYSNFSVSHLGCTGTFSGSKTITNPPAATLTAGLVTQPSTCGGTDGSIAFNSALGDGTYTLNYLGLGSQATINIASNSFNLSSLAAGTYSNFSITIPGCISSDVVSKVLADPVITASASNAGPYQEGQKIDLNATGGTSYTWTGPNGFFSTLQNPSIPEATLSHAGVYSVTVSEPNNCSGTASTLVSLSCSSQALNYYLVFTDGSPQIIAPLVPNLQVQASSRPMSVIAISACEAPLIESVKLQLSGTTNLQFQVDNDMPFNLHDFYNTNPGEVLTPNYHTFIGRGYSQDNAQGSIINGPDVIGFNIVGSGRSITSVSTSVSEVCVGSTFSVSTISANNTNYPYGTGNAYQVYLSDVNGDFMSRTLIGSGTNSSSISCQIPMYMPGSDKYKVMVISTSPIVTSQPSITALNVIGNDLTLKSPIDDINSSVINHKSISAIKAENKITGTAKSALTAGKYIELNPGFSIETNAVFQASIENNCGL